MVELWSPKPTMGVRFPLLLFFLKIFTSKNDKQLPFLGFKTLLEECFGDCLIIKDYNELDQYNLTLFPQEIVVIYYCPSMINHNKYHHLINTSRYIIIITDSSWFYDNEPLMTIGFNNVFIPWFFNKTMNYFKEKYKMNFLLDDNNKKLSIGWIISKKYDPLMFCKTIFFLQDLAGTINYLENITKKQAIIHNQQFQTPFMFFYKLMMANYGGKMSITTNELLTYIISFNHIFLIHKI